MAYEKTAKDKAWDRERVKFHAEIQKWEKAYRTKSQDVALRDEKIVELEAKVSELEAAIIDLTKGSMTPEEAVKNMRKQAELSDTLKFLANGARGLF